MAAKQAFWWYKCGTFTLAIACLPMLYFVTKYPGSSSELLETRKDIALANFQHTTPSIQQEQDAKKSFGIVHWPGGEPVLGLKSRTCAYVASSGHMLGSNKGEEINRHDLVIRSNDAVILGYEKDVGEKTTFRLCNVWALMNVERALKKNWYIFGKNITNTLIVMVHDGKKFRPQMGNFRKSHPTVPLVEYTRERYDNIESTHGKDLNNTKLWTACGYHAILLMREMCDEIDVYGMSSPEFCRDKAAKGGPIVGDVPYHYYNGGGGKECQFFLSSAKAKADTHWYIREKEVFRAWTKELPPLRFHSPEWH